MSKLSVVISAYNEEEKIKDCLASVSFADEIIFVDNSSTDKTLSIAKKFTSKTIKRENNPMLNVNKNFGFLKASGEWILSLDADERVTPELRKEIEKIILIENEISGYWIPRKNIIFGKWIENAGWYPDYQLRLFKKSKGKFEEKHVHEMINLDGESGKLNGPILHYNYENISQFLTKTILYTENEAMQMIQAGYIFAWQDALRLPVKEFLSRFFARKGYKDGLHGLVLSLLMSFYHLLVFARIWEKNNFTPYGGEEFMEETSREFKKIGGELRHWTRTAKNEKIKNPLVKGFRRITDKIS